MKLRRSFFFITRGVIQIFVFLVFFLQINMRIDSLMNNDERTEINSTFSSIKELD